MALLLGNEPSSENGRTRCLNNAEDAHACAYQVFKVASPITYFELFVTRKGK